MTLFALIAVIALFVVGTGALQWTVIPGIRTFSYSFPSHLLDPAIGEETRKYALIKSTNVDGTAPTSRFRAGNVVVLETSTGKYIEANDAAGDRNTAAVVTSLEAPDTDWDGTIITVEGPFGSISVTLAGTDDSTSEVVTALNANAPLRAHVVASGADLAALVITSLKKGKDAWLKVTQSVITTGYGANGIEDFGADADYGVTEEHVELTNSDGTAVDARTVIRNKGRFRRSALQNLTAEAEAVLERLGSQFVS